MAGHEYPALIHSARGSAAFIDNRYSRGHTWRCDGGSEAPASASPSAADLEALHQRAHEHCFVANSLNSDVRVEPP